MPSPPPLTPDQCRAARALVGWPQDKLEAASKIAKKTIADFELGNTSPYERTLTALRSALERAGVEFIAQGDDNRGNGKGPGVRLAKPSRK